MKPEEIASLIGNVARRLWQSEWNRADLCALLEDSCDEPTFRRLCRDEIGTSHRNVARWAKLARYFPEEARSPEYSLRRHMTWARKDGAL